MQLLIFRFSLPPDTPNPKILHKRMTLTGTKLYWSTSQILKGTSTLVYIRRMCHFQILVRTQITITVALSGTFRLQVALFSYWKHWDKYVLTWALESNEIAFSISSSIHCMMFYEFSRNLQIGWFSACPATNVIALENWIKNEFCTQGNFMYRIIKQWKKHFFCNCIYFSFAV